MSGSLLGLLFQSAAPTPGQGRTITAGVITVSLSVPGALLQTSATIDAGVITISLRPEGAQVYTDTSQAEEVPSVTAAEALAAGLLVGHEPRSRVITYTSGGSVRSTYDPATITLTGNVTYDRARNVRRFGSLSLVDEDGSLAPLKAGDEFAPGESLRIERGLRVSGQNVYQTLGQFEVNGFTSSMAGTLSLTVEDPSLALQQPFGEVVTIAKGARAADALRTLWEPVLGDGSDWDLEDDSMTLDAYRSFVEDDDRLASVLTLMSDLGLEVYMGRDGLPVMQPVQDPNDVSVSHTWEQAPGVARATSVARSGDWRPYNRQVVIGEPADRKPIRAVVDITDTTSPLHRNRIGLRVAPLHRSAQITTQHQANTVARNLLVEHAMWSDTVIWTGVPDPTVEAGDVVKIVEPQTGTGATYRIDQVTIPVTLGAMTMTASLVIPLFT